MGDEIEVKITRRETIKPCSPTPQHLRILNLSFLDQIAPDVYVPLVLFYPMQTSSNDTDLKNPNEIWSDRSQRLKETLAKALVHFYPLAGILQNNISIECNDHGVEFSEARASCFMSKLLERPALESLKNFLPGTTEASLEGRLLLVQVTMFVCGGMALGLSFSHKICDAGSVATFVKSWAKIAQNDDAAIISPEFGKTFNVFPPCNDLSRTGIRETEFAQDHKCLTRRYVFEPKKIEALKTIASSEHGTKNPTRVEAVSGFIWKCAMEAASRSNANNNNNNDPLGFSKKSFFCQFVNMRNKNPALASDVIGNLVGVFFVTADESERDIIGLEELVFKLKRGIEEVKENYASSGFVGFVERGYEEYTKVMNGSEKFDIYNCSSWCRIGMYESDFGWKKPAWVSIVSASYKNCVLLMDTRDGDGVEAWLMFNEEVMAFIETNKEFLAFASLNPSVV